MLPIGLLVGLLIILGIATIVLTGTINDKDVKVTDMNASIITLTVQVNALNADNLQVKTNYNNLLTTYNATTAALTTSQTQVATLTGANGTLTAEKAGLVAEKTALLSDKNILLFDKNILLIDKHNLLIDNNKWKLDYNNLYIDRNNLYITNNDYNARAHRLYTALYNCYLSVKTYKDVNLIIGAADYNIIKNTCITQIDVNIGDYNYFS